MDAILSFGASQSDARALPPCRSAQAIGKTHKASRIQRVSMTKRWSPMLSFYSGLVAITPTLESAVP